MSGYFSLIMGIPSNQGAVAYYLTAATGHDIYIKGFEFSVNKPSSSSADNSVSFELFRVSSVPGTGTTTQQIGRLDTSSVRQFADLELRYSSPSTVSEELARYRQVSTTDPLVKNFHDTGIKVAAGEILAFHFQAPDNVSSPPGYEAFATVWLEEL